MKSLIVAKESPCAPKMTSEVKFDAQRQNLTSDLKFRRHRCVHPTWLRNCLHVKFSLAGPGRVQRPAGDIRARRDRPERQRVQLWGAGLLRHTRPDGGRVAVVRGTVGRRLGRPLRRQDRLHLGAPGRHVSAGKPLPKQQVYMTLSFAM